MGQEEKIREYLEKYLNKGYPRKSLRRALIQNGYSPKAVDSVFKEFKERKEAGPAVSVKLTMPKIKATKKTYGIVLVILIAAAVAYAIFLMPKEDCGYNKACFIEKANSCENAVLREKVEDTETTVRFTAKGCNLVKTIESFDKAEPEEVVALFDGKEMSCGYERGAFIDDLTDGLVGGIEGCSGELKDAIYELRIAQHEIGTE